MSNPNYDALQEQSVAVEDAKHRLDSTDDISHSEDFNRSFLLPARIKSLNKDSSDEFVVDIYEQGYTITDDDGPTDGPVTRPDVTAHAMHAGDWFQVGDTVLVRLMPDNSAWIVHDYEPQLAVICCNGPNGEADRKDNFYWACFGRMWNTDSAIAPHKIAAYPSSSKNHRVVLAENFFEHQCKTHLVRPGAPVVLKWNWDLATPPNRRYFFESADEGTCVPPCSQSTSSSSSSGSSSSDECKNVCWYKWTVKWRCKTKGFEPPEVIPTCNDVNFVPAQPLNEWFYEGVNDDDPTDHYCVFSYLVKTKDCCSTAGTCTNPPPYPGNPTNPGRCCTSSSGSSTSTSTSHSTTSSSSSSSSSSSTTPTSITMECMGVKDVDIDIDDCKITLTLTMCDDSTRTKTVKVPCCCTDHTSSSSTSTSSSSSTSSYSGSSDVATCQFRYSVFYHCETNEYNLVPTLQEAMCGNDSPSLPRGVWYRESADPMFPGLCVVSYIVKTNNPCSDASSCVPSSDDAPTPPTRLFVKNLCCNESSVGSDESAGSSHDTESSHSDGDIFWGCVLCGTYDTGVYMVTDAQKEAMVTSGKMIFRALSDTRCFRLDTSRWYTSTTGFAVVTPTATFASCAECQGA